MNINQSLYDRITGLSNSELYKMVFEEHSNYREDALEIARKEMDRRGLDQDNYEEQPVEACLPKELGVGWLKFYVYVSIPYGIINSFYVAYNNPSWYNYLIVGIASTAAVLTMYAMHKWKIWGWNLNIILLLLAAFAMPVLRARSTDGYISIAISKLLIWCIPNFIYLWRRRKYFNAYR